MQWMLDIVSWIKNNWLDIVLYGSIFLVILFSLFVRNTLRKLKAGVASLFTLDGAIIFLLSSIAMITLLMKLGII